MTKRHTIYDELDPFDSIEEVDGFEGRLLTDDAESVESVWYNGTAEEVLCDMGIGDEYGLCVKSQYGCHVEGCQYASPND